MQNFLEFERPIAELESKIEELRHLPTSADLNIAEEVGILEAKASKLLKQTYAKLNAWQKVQVARHPDRPHFLDYAASLLTEFTPLAGDRAFADDAAVLVAAQPVDAAKRRALLLRDCLPDPRELRQ